MDGGGGPSPDPLGGSGGGVSNDTGLTQVQRQHMVMLVDLVLVVLYNASYGGGGAGGAAGQVVLRSIL